MVSQAAPSVVSNLTSDSFLIFVKMPRKRRNIMLCTVFMEGNWNIVSYSLDWKTKKVDLCVFSYYINLFVKTFYIF